MFSFLKSIYVGRRVRADFQPLKDVLEVIIHYDYLHSKLAVSKIIPFHIGYLLHSFETLSLNNRIKESLRHNEMKYIFNARNEFLTHCEFVDLLDDNTLDMLVNRFSVDIELTLILLELREKDLQYKNL